MTAQTSRSRRSRAKPYRKPVRKPILDADSAKGYYESGELLHTPGAGWLLDGFFQRRAVTLMFGRTTVGKTQLAMALAGATAREHSWGGVKFSSGMVVYITCEDEESRADRYKAWLTLNQETMSAVDGINWVNGESEKFNLMSDLPALSANMAKWSKDKKLPVRLLVIDHLRRAMRGVASHGGKAAQAVMEDLERIAKEHNCAVVLIGHTSKKSEELSGPGVWGHYAQAMYHVIGNSETVALISDKQRNGVPMNMRFRRMPVIVGKSGNRTRTSAALLFDGFAGMEDEQSAELVLFNSICAVMKVGEKLSYKELSERLFDGNHGGNQSARIKRALTPNWKTSILPGRPAIAVRREMIGGREFIVACSPEDLTIYGMADKPKPVRPKRPPKTGLDEANK